MRRMAAVAPFLDNVTALAKRRPYLGWNSKIFALDPHSIKRNGVTALLKLFKRLGMTFTALVRENHGLLLGSRLVVDVASDAMDPVLRML